MSIRVQFGAVPDWVDERCTSPQAMRVYVRLARKYAAYDRTAFPSQEKLADELGVTSRTVRTALTHLRDIGALRTAQFDRGDGQWPRNEYWLPTDPPGTENEFQRNETSSGRRKDTSSGQRKKSSDYPDPYTQTQVTQISATGVAGEFDRFWQAYPRKVGKADARKKFTREAKTHGAEHLIAEAERWAGLWHQAGTEQQFIPHPATWLNGQRWDDEPPPTQLRAVHQPWRSPDPNEYYEDIQ